MRPGPDDPATRGAAAPLLPPLTSLTWVAETGSTNADLLADPDGPSGAVLVTDHQTAGRGRRGRRWEEPPGSSLMFSVRLRPSLPTAARGWLPLLTGVAVAEAVARVLPPDVPVRLKWPNDVLVGADERKVAGILAEAAGDVVVIGVGCNVAQSTEELPVPDATSLVLAGAVGVDRAALLSDVLDGLAGGLRALEAAAGDATAAGLADRWAALSATLGRPVRVTRTTDVLTGRAVRLASDGGLVVAADGREVTVVAGDVTHVRPA